MDRWHVLSTLNYLPRKQEEAIIQKKIPELKGKENQEIIKNMVLLAELTRQGFINGDISTLMSPRTVLSWAQNYLIFNNLLDSFSLTFLNKCDDLEKPIVMEYFQRCFEEKNDS